MANPNISATEVTFYGANGLALTKIDNWTEFNLERNFFVAPDAFTMVLEDDRAQQLSAQIYMGMAIKIVLKGVTGSTSQGLMADENQVAMLGFIFNYHYDYDRTGHGQRLTISGQDLLGWANKSVCLPNLGNKAINTNFHFKPTDHIDTCITTILNAFNASAPAFVNSGISYVYFDDKSTIQTGGKQGLQQSKKGKGRAISKSIQTALNHLSSPNMGETYLQYAIRLAKHVGQNIKMKWGNATNVVQIAAPTYDPNGTEYHFRLTHSLSNPVNNNVLTGSMHIDVESQPSVLIVEKATSGNNFYYQQQRKCIVVNEVSGYPQGAGGGVLQPAIQTGGTSTTASNTTGGNSVHPIDNVNNAISQLVNKYNYIQIKPNQNLYDFIAQSGIRQVNTAISSPEYVMDLSAHTDDELQFAAAKRLAEAQDKYITLNYLVDGFFQDDGFGNSFLWQTDAMCQVTDEALDINGLFWIKKVNFTQSRTGGTHTYIELSLPYTHLGLESIEQQQSINQTQPTPPDYSKNLYVNGKPVTGFTRGPNGEWVPSTVVVGTP